MLISVINNNNLGSCDFFKSLFSLNELKGVPAEIRNSMKINY